MKEYVLEVFFDGDCPLCRREIDWLEGRNREKAVRFTNLADSDFSEDRAGKTYEELMGHIHGKRPDGSWVQGIDLFAELYALCKLPMLARLMRSRLLRPLMAAGYNVFAKYRLRLTGRPACGTSCRSILKA